MKKRNRKLCAVLLVLSMALSVMGTVRMNVPARAANKNRITGIRMVNPASSVLTMQRGGTFQLKTECSPKSVKNVKVKYRSGKPSVASVSADGVIRAKKTGTARITAFAANQSAKRVSVKVTVVKKLKKVSRVTLNARMVNLYLNGDAGQKSYKLAARTAPGNATVKKVVFQSSNKAVATVSQKGMIRAKKEGQATITAYAADGWGKKAACKVVVGSRPAQTAMQQTDRPAGSGSETPKPTPEQPATEVPSPAPTVDKSFELASANHSAQIFLDEKGADYEGLKLVANCFAEDVKLVADAEPDIVTDESELTGTPVIAGSIGNNEIISRLAVEGKLDLSPIEGKWETYRMAVVENPLEGIERALVIAGSDKRGTMYGIFHLSELMGVSPWVYWADVNPEKQDTVSFLYSQINSYGTVCIKGNGQEVVLGVSAAIMNISSRDPMTFMETDGYISIEAEHYADAKPGKDQSEWKVIPGYGRGLSSLKVFPTTAKFSDASDAPYVEYKVFAYGDEDYNMDTYFAPSNPVDADNISMKFGVSVDGGDIQQIDVITNSYTAGAWSDSTWSKGVQNNVHTITAELGNLAWGEHTIRIYAVDPALVLQKIVLYSDSKLPASYFGPPESYYTGK